MEPRYRCGRPVEASEPAAASRHVAGAGADDQLGPRPARRGRSSRSTEDLGALRIFDPEHPDRTVLAAGAPWFMTVFGRDSLLTAWMTLIADPTLAAGVLETLARFQGDDVNPTPRRSRARSSTRCASARRPRSALGGGRIYYGSIDATPLFVMLLGELRRWGLADEVVDAAAPARRPRARVDRASSATATATATSSTSARSDRGLANQGWKDSLGRDPLRRRRARGAPDRAVRGAGLRVRRVRRPGRTSPDERATTDCADAATSDKAADLRRGSTRTSGSTSTAGTRSASTPTSGRSTRSASNMGHCLWTGHRRRRTGRDRGGAPHVRRDVLAAGGSARWRRRWRRSTRSATTTGRCGRTTTRSAPPG